MWLINQTGVVFMFGRIQKVDNRVLERIGNIQKPALNKIMITFSRAGNLGIVWWVICAIFLLRPDWSATGVCMIVALTVSHIMGEVVIKHLVKRVRPCHRLADDEQLINRPRFYSFPSGHTTASFAAVGVALLKCTALSFVPILLLAVSIGFSRIYLRVHYLTDVLAGALLGFICGILTVIIAGAVIPV